MSVKLWIFLLVSIGIFAALIKRYGEDTVLAVLFCLAMVGVMLAFLGFGTIEY